MKGNLINLIDYRVLTKKDLNGLIFKCLLHSNWWNIWGNIQQCGHFGEGMSLGMSLEGRKPLLASALSFCLCLCFSLFVCMCMCVCLPHLCWSDVSTQLLLQYHSYLPAAMLSTMTIIDSNSLELEDALNDFSSKLFWIQCFVKR